MEMFHKWDVLNSSIGSPKEKMDAFDKCSFFPYLFPKKITILIPQACSEEIPFHKIADISNELKLQS